MQLERCEQEMIRNEMFHENTSYAAGLLKQNDRSCIYLTFLMNSHSSIVSFAFIGPQPIPIKTYVSKLF